MSCLKAKFENGDEPMSGDEPSGDVESDGDEADLDLEKARQNLKRPPVPKLVVRDGDVERILAEVGFTCF